VDLRESHRELRCLIRVTVPEQVKVTGELGGAVHDARHLTDHRDPGSVLVECPQERQRVEGKRVVGVHGAADVVSVLVSAPGAGAASYLHGETA
jgi:hypothetical protein